jgi:hypothetical protein
MADHAEDLRQDDLAKLPFFSGDKTNIFTCEQWISRVQHAKDLSGWTNARTMTYVINALRGSAFAYTSSINLTSDVEIDNWDSFKAALVGLLLCRPHFSNHHGQHLEPHPRPK